MMHISCKQILLGVGGQDNPVLHVCTGLCSEKRCRPDNNWTNSFAVTVTIVDQWPSRPAATVTIVDH